MEHERLMAQLSGATKGIFCSIIFFVIAKIKKHIDKGNSNTKNELSYYNYI